MFRCILVMSLVLCAAAAAQVTRPIAAATTRPVAVALTPAQLHDMQVQAVALLNSKTDFAKGAALLHKVYLQTPAEQRSRLLVINHAIVDLIQKTNVARGIGDLAKWLNAQPQPDELAINVLGASLNLMAERYNGKKGASWQSAMQVWEQQNAKLEQTRPGMHRWGAEWMDQDQYEKIQFQRDRQANQLRDQQQVVQLAQADLDSAVQRRSGIKAGLQGRERRQSDYEKAYEDWQRQVAANQGQGLLTQDQIMVFAEMSRLDREVIPPLRQRLADEQAALQKLSESTIRPTWPVRFDPIEPDTVGTVVRGGNTTQPATTQPIVATPTTAPPAIARPTIARPTTQPLPLPSDPHARAVVFMKQGDWKKAREIFDALWKATPPDKRTRALVVNRAIVDMTDQRFSIRALRDLGDYLANHPDTDEQATNVLGGALNNAAGDPKLKRNPIWQSAWKEWDRRSEELDQSRPGFRRWGAQWLSDEQYTAMRERQKALEEAIRQQAELVDADLRRAGAIEQQMSVKEFIEDETGPIPTTSPVAHPNGSNREFNQNLFHHYDLNALKNRLQVEGQNDMTRLSELVSQRERPQWPTGFQPIDPTDPPEGSR